MTGPGDPRGRESKLHPIKNPDSPAGQLARTLRELVGGESLRKLATRAHCGVATLSDAALRRPTKSADHGCDQGDLRGMQSRRADTGAVVWDEG